MKQSHYAKIAMVVKNYHPEIFNSISSSMEPTLKDISLIKTFYEMYHNGNGKKSDFRQKIVFIASILKLYSPATLLYGSKVTCGVLTALQKAYGCNNKQSLGLYTCRTPAYYKNPSFREEIEKVSQLFKEVI